MKVMFAKTQKRPARASSQRACSGGQRLLSNMETKPWTENTVLISANNSGLHTAI